MHGIAWARRGIDRAIQRNEAHGPGALIEARRDRERRVGTHDLTACGGCLLEGVFREKADLIQQIGSGTSPSSTKL